MTTPDTPQSARSALAACQSKNLREYCGWTGNTEDDIVTTGNIVKQMSLFEL